MVRSLEAGRGEWTGWGGDGGLSPPHKAPTGQHGRARKSTGSASLGGDREREQFQLSS